MNPSGAPSSNARWRAQARVDLDAISANVAALHMGRDYVRDHLSTIGLQVIRAEVPLSEMLSYDAELTSMTGARGSYHMEYSHYDEVPAHLQTKIISTAKAERAGVEVEEV